MSWTPITERLPEPCAPVIGHSSAWMCEDFNPSGIRECFLMDEGTWNSAFWNNYQDTYETDEETAPEFWMPYPPAP